MMIRVEVSSFRDFESEGREVVIPGKDIVDVTSVGRVVLSSSGEIHGPESLISGLGVVSSHISGPNSVVNESLSIVPLIEVVTSSDLVAGVHGGSVFHLVDELLLTEDLIDHDVVLLLVGSVTRLAGLEPDLESSTHGGGVEGLEESFLSPVEVAVVLADRIDLLFVTVNAVGSADVVTVNPRVHLFVLLEVDEPPHHDTHQA